MRYAGFYRDVKQASYKRDISSLPSILDQPRTPDTELLEVVSQYLDGGYQLGHKLGWSSDVFKAEVRTRLDTLTDGEWVWPADASYYSRTYGILPSEHEFVLKIQGANGKYGSLDPSELLYIEYNWLERAL